MIRIRFRKWVYWVWKWALEWSECEKSVISGAYAKVMNFDFICGYCVFLDSQINKIRIGRLEKCISYRNDKIPSIEYTTSVTPPPPPPQTNQSSMDYMELHSSQAFRISSIGLQSNNGYSNNAIISPLCDRKLTHNKCQSYFFGWQFHHWMMILNNQF